MRDMSSANPHSGLRAESIGNRGEQSGSALSQREPLSRESLSRESSLRGAKPNSAPSAIDLQIDELVLTGFSPRDRFHIADAVERELSVLLAEKGIPGLDGNSDPVEALDAGKFKVGPAARAHVIGKRAAQAVYRQLWLQSGDAARRKRD